MDYEIIDVTPANFNELDGKILKMLVYDSMEEGIQIRLLIGVDKDNKRAYILDGDLTDMRTLGEIEKDKANNIQANYTWSDFELRCNRR